MVILPFHLKSIYALIDVLPTPVSGEDPSSNVAKNKPESLITPQSLQDGPSTSCIISCIYAYSYC